MKKEKSNIKELVLGLIPWIGFALMQCMNIPNVIQAVETGVSMPVTSVIMLIAALCCYLVDSVRRKCKLHMVSSTIGITSNIVVLLCII